MSTNITEWTSATTLIDEAWTAIANEGDFSDHTVEAGTEAFIAVRKYYKSMEMRPSLEAFAAVVSEYFSHWMLDVYITGEPHSWDD